MSLTPQPPGHWTNNHWPLSHFPPVYPHWPSFDVAPVVYTPPSVDMASVLEDESSLGLLLQVNLFAGGEPTSPDNCVTIFDTPGAPPEQMLEQGDYYYRPSVQVRVRNKSYLDGWMLMEDIKTVLHGNGHFIIEPMHYQSVFCSMEPALLDWDDNGRARFVSTFDIEMKRED